MITFDGDRSKKRKWLANKLLRVIKDIDVPAKAIKYDGFTIKVWQQDDLYGGRITAPMGAVVICSTREGIKIATSDNWAGACTSYADLHILYVDNNTEVTTLGLPLDDMIENGFQVIKAKPDVMSAYWGEPAEQLPDFPCTPSVMPYKGAEAFVVTVTDKQFIDLNNNGIADFPYASMDTTVTGYNSDNSNLNGRRSIILANGVADIWKTCINLPNGEQVSFIGQEYDRDSAFIWGRITYEGIDPETEQLTQIVETIYLSQIVPPGKGMPEDLRQLMLNTWVSLIRPLGSYVFLNSEGKRVIIHAAFFNPLALSLGGDSTTVRSYFFDNPNDQKWTIFLSVTIGTETTLVSSDQFFDVLNAKATKPLTKDMESDTYNWWVPGSETQIIWTNTSSMLRYLFAWPNLSSLYSLYYGWEPHDSFMFHSHNDSVYTWTRAVESIEINQYGLFATSIQVPLEVSENEGVRPDISHAGNGLYFCACNKIGESILATYYGSPFFGDTWHKLPDPPEHSKLVYVRPVKVTEELIILIGVLKQEIPDKPAVYRFAHLYWIPDEPTPWKPLMVLPFEISEADNFAVCLYGRGQLVQDLLTYPAPPSAHPQHIVGPYSAYAKWQP